MATGGISPGKRDNLMNRAPAARRVVASVLTRAERRGNVDEGLTSAGPVAFQPGDAEPRRGRQAALLPPARPESIPTDRWSARWSLRLPRLLVAIRRTKRLGYLREPVDLSDAASAEFDSKLAEHWPFGWFGPAPTITRKH